MGLCEAHFGWDASVATLLRRKMFWIAVVGTPLLFATLHYDMSGGDFARSHVGRALFVATAVFLLFQLGRLFRPDQGILAPTAGSRRFALRRGTRIVIYLAMLALAILFYRVPKTAVLLLGIAAAIGGLASYWQPRSRAWRRPLLFLVLSLALVPATAGFLKSITDVHCPSQLTRYGGTEPYDGPAAQLLASVETTTRGRCFPAGHAAGGFALLAFGWLASTRRRRLAGWTFGFAMGVVMGWYQMARGVHFLSHTLTTLLLALTILGYLDRAILRPAVSGQTVR
jgi:membrane-associated PAP2 superfamily phosphatase